MAETNSNENKIRKDVMKSFTNVQNDCAYSKYVKILKKCLLENKEETKKAINQITLQLFSWTHRSKRVSKIYTLLRKFLENAIHGIYEVKPSENAVLLKNSAFELSKEILLTACYCCGMPNYMVKVRSSYIMRIIFEACGIQDLLADPKISQELEKACLILLRGMANLKAIAIKLVPQFEKSGSENSPWTLELLRIMGVCKTIEYRISALKSITISEFTLPYILKKTQDIDENVRCATFQKLLNEKISLAILSRSQKYDILLNGLLDNKEKVRNSCAAYLKANINWLFEKNAIPLSIYKKKVPPEYRKFKSDAGDFTELETELPAQAILSEKKEKIQTNCEKIIQLLKLCELKNLADSNEHCICIKPLCEFAILESNAIEITEFFKTNIIEKLLQNETNIETESLILLRISLDLFGVNNPKAKMILEPENILPEPVKIEGICANLIKKNSYKNLHEILLLFTHYNYTEPTINDTLIKILDKILRDASTEGLNSFDEKSIQLSENSSQFDKNTLREYQQLIYDQLDLHRRDIIVRNMSDITYVALKIMQQLMNSESNRFRDKLMMYIADFQEQIEEITNKLEEFRTKASTSQDTTHINQNFIEDPEELCISQSNLITRALKLAVHLLQTCAQTVSAQTIEAINMTLVTPVLQSESGNEFIKFLATQYLGLFSLLDIEKSKALFPLFKALIKGISTFQTLPGIASLKSIFDIFLIHSKDLFGKNIISTPTKTNESTADFIGTLHELQLLMYSPNYRLRMLVYENFTKLIFCDKIKLPERYLTLLFLILSDPLENETEVNGIKQIITLGLKNYTKLSQSRAKHLSNAIIVFTIIWLRANADPSKVVESTILSRIMKCQYTTIVSYLVYILTTRYIGNSDIQSMVAEVMIQIIKVIITHIDIMGYLQCAIAICLRFVELDNISKSMQIVLYKHWMEFIRRAKYREKEYYTFGIILRNKILQKPAPRQSDSEKTQEDSPSDEKTESEIKTMEKSIDSLAMENCEEIRQICEKLEKRFTKMESLATKLYTEFNELLIDIMNGCTKIIIPTIKPTKPQYQSGILTNQNKGGVRKNSKIMNSAGLLETPRRFQNFSKKKIPTTSQKKINNNEMETIESVSRKTKNEGENIGSGLVNSKN